MARKYQNQVGAQPTGNTNNALPQQETKEMITEVMPKPEEKEVIVKEPVLEKPIVQDSNPFNELQAMHQEIVEEKAEKFTQITIYLNEENLRIFKKHFKKKGKKSEFINNLLKWYFESMGMK